MDADRQMAIAQKALRLLSERCPRLTGLCYWAGTASVALEELHHRQSFDLDFHTRKALQDVRPILAEIRDAFPGGLEVVQTPDEFGSGFSGVLTLPDRNKITIEVLSNYQNVSDDELVSAQTAPKMKRVSLSRYLADKIQCVAERAEVRDLADVMAVLERHPAMEQEARERLAEQDALLVAERLLAWTDEEIARDLESYQDVRPEKAGAARDLLLKWLKEKDSTSK